MCQIFKLARSFKTARMKMKFVPESTRTHIGKWNKLKHDK